MLFLLSLVIRAFARLLAGRRSDGGAKDLEILVLRHQLDRDRWASFMVTPQTLVR